jgi:hypothetical protein
MWDVQTGLNMTRGPWSLDVTTSHDTMRHCRHRADDNCVVGGRDSETQIKLFYKFERRKELDGGAVSQGILLQHEKRLSVIRREGDDAIVIFGAARQGLFRIGHTTWLMQNYGKSQCVLRATIAWIQSTYNLSRHGVRPVGTDIRT